MSVEIPTHYVKQFSAGIRLLQQQMPSRFGEAVDVEPGVVGDRAFFDQVDSVEMVDITDRHGDTQINDTPHRRRMVTMFPAERADLIDRADVRRVLTNPQSAYSRSFMAAANRKKDDRIIAAFFAAANTGVDGGTSVAFPTATHQVAASVGSTTGMNVDKILRGQEILRDSENIPPEEGGEWYIAMSPRQLYRDLLGDSSDNRVTSSDFNTMKPIADGQLVDGWMGFRRIILSTRLGLTGSDRRCVMWNKMSMKLGVSEDTRMFADVRADKRHSVQVRAELDVGATRMDEKGVVEILCTES